MEGNAETGQGEMESRRGKEEEYYRAEGGQGSGVRTTTGQGRFECVAAQKATRSQCDCMTGAVWTAMQDKHRTEMEETQTIGTAGRAAAQDEWHGTYMIA